MKPWFGYPAVHPPETGVYLCWVEAPTERGLSRFDMKVLFWSQLNGGWHTKDCIVRYWQILPEPPGGGAG